MMRRNRKGERFPRDGLWTRTKSRKRRRSRQRRKKTKEPLRLHSWFCNRRSGQNNDSAFLFPYRPLGGSNDTAVTRLNSRQEKFDGLPPPPHLPRRGRITLADCSNSWKRSASLTAFLPIRIGKVLLTGSIRETPQSWTYEYIWKRKTKRPRFLDFKYSCTSTKGCIRARA